MPSRALGCGDSKEASKVAVGEVSSPATAAIKKASAHYSSLQSERDDVREGSGGGGGGGAGGYEAKVKAADDYPGMAKGVEMLVRDQFTSKYSKERMCKWRHATIRAIFPPNGLRINFTGPYYNYYCYCYYYFRARSCTAHVYSPFLRGYLTLTPPTHTDTEQAGKISTTFSWTWAERRTAVA